MRKPVGIAKSNYLIVERLAPMMFKLRTVSPFLCVLDHTRAVGSMCRLSGYAGFLLCSVFVQHRLGASMAPERYRPRAIAPGRSTSSRRTQRFGSALPTRQEQKNNALSEACELSRRRFFLVEPHRSILPSDVVEWLRRNPKIERLNIAGNRSQRIPALGSGLSGS